MNVPCSTSSSTSKRRLNSKQKRSRRSDVSTCTKRRKLTRPKEDKFSHDEFYSILERRDKIFEEFDKKRLADKNKRVNSGSDSDSRSDPFSDSILDIITPENSPKLRRRVQQKSNDVQTANSPKPTPSKESTPVKALNDMKIARLKSTSPELLTITDDSDSDDSDSSPVLSAFNKNPLRKSFGTLKNRDDEYPYVPKLAPLSSGNRVPDFIAKRAHILDENGLPLTQPALAHLLKGVVAYVDVRSGADNRSSGVQDQLHKLGATTLNRYNSKVTHLLYSNGSQAVLRKAYAKGIHIVSALWIDACLRTGEWADEKLYKPYNLDKLLSPTAPKLRRFRSMQPKSLEEDMADAERRIKRRQKCEEKKRLATASSEVEQPETPPKANLESVWDRVILPQLASWTPTVRVKSYNIDDNEDDYFESKYSTPLAVRALARMNSPLLQARLAELGMAPRSELAIPMAKSPSCPSMVAEVIKENGASLKRLYSSLSDVETENKHTKEGGEDVMPKEKRTCLKRVGKQLFPKTLSVAVTGEVIVAVTPNEPSTRKNVHVSADLATPVLTKPLLIPQAKQKCQNAESVRDEQLSNTAPVEETMNIANFAQNSQNAQQTMTLKSLFLSPSSNTASRAEKSENDTNSGNSKKSRNSLDDFVSPILKTTQKQARITSYFTSPQDSQENKLPTIVSTSLPPNESEQLYAIVEKLGGFRIKDKADRTTTHIICGSPRRTMNLVQGLVQGVWLLPFSWVRASMKAGKWQPEVSYELQDYPSAKIYREIKDRGERIALFAKVGLIYVSPQSVIPQKEVISLVENGGGLVTMLARAAAVILGEPKPNDKHKNKTATYLESKWVLDCIQQYQILPFKT